MAKWIGKTLLSFLSLALFTISLHAATIPEFKVKVVAEENGAPQEWIRVEMRARAEVRNIVGTQYYKYYFYELRYLWTRDGVITVPKRSFMVLDLVHYKGWEVVISSPGHGPVTLRKEDMERIGAKDGPYLLKINRQGGGQWLHAGGLDVESPSEWEAPTALTVSFEQVMFYAMHNKYLLDNWDIYKDKYYLLGASSPEEQLKVALAGYLVRASDAVKLQAKEREGSPYKSMPVAATAAEYCARYRARYPEFFNGEMMPKWCQELEQGRTK